TGIGVGVAATSRTWLPRLLAPVIGFGLAVLAHALWNLAAVSGGQGMLTVYLLVEVPIFVAFVAFVGWTRRREGHLIGQFLRPYADAGWLSPAEVAMLSSMPRRREARAWARANTGRHGLAAMRAFQDTASELALLRRRMHHSAADRRAVDQERELLDALRQRRLEFVGMPAS
ncbi:MAG TPA: PrsW family glutamic-type intramembrane protease, partial [Ornithinibacter sp.]|nr:PrsW family glutamic-type intramembrane protease [Ornithinibacter sp.]